MLCPLTSFFNGRQRPTGSNDPAEQTKFYRGDNVFADPPSVNNALKLTYTGTPRAAIMLPLAPGVVTIPPALVAGQATYSPTPGQHITGLTYTEVAALGTTTGPHLLTLSFDDCGGCAGDFALTNFPSLTALSLPVFMACAGNFAPVHMPLLTTLSHPALLYAGYYQPAFLDTLATLSAASLQHVVHDFYPQFMAGLTSWNFPSLASVGGDVRAASFGSLVTLSFPALAFVGGNFNPNTMASLTSLGLAALANVLGDFHPQSMGALTTINAPALANVSGNITIDTMASLTTVSLANLVTCPGTISLQTSNGNLTSVTLGTPGVTKALTGASIRIDGQKLTAASVNAILALLVSLDGTNGTTFWGSKTLIINGGTNAAPTGQGITDKATLIARSASITTN